MMCQPLIDKDMRALESSYITPVEDLADNIRNYVVIPLLRMAQRPEGLEVNRKDKLLDIGSFIEEIEKNNS